MRRVVAGRLLLFSTAVYAGLTLGGILAVYLGWDWITDTPERATVISGAAGAFFVSLGLIFVAIQFIQTEKQRHWDSTSDLVSSWDSSEMRQCRAAIMAVVNAGNSLATKLQETERNAPSAYLELMVVGQFFEHLGFAVEKGAIAEYAYRVDSEQLEERRRKIATLISLLPTELLSVVGFAIRGFGYVSSRYLTSPFFKLF